MQRISKPLLTLLSLIVLLHSISLYAMPPGFSEETTSIETTHESDQQEFQLKAYDALIPSFQGMAPMVLYLIQEVVLLTQVEFQEHPLQVDYENQYKEILFPLIISPNAP